MVLDMDTASKEDTLLYRAMVARIRRVLKKRGFKSLFSHGYSTKRIQAFHVVPDLRRVKTTSASDRIMHGLGISIILLFGDHTVHFMRFEIQIGSDSVAVIATDGQSTSMTIEGLCQAFAQIESFDQITYLRRDTLKEIGELRS